MGPSVSLRFYISLSRPGSALNITDSTAQTAHGADLDEEAKDELRQLDIKVGKLRRAGQQSPPDAHPCLGRALWRLCLRRAKIRSAARLRTVGGGRWSSGRSREGVRAYLGLASLVMKANAPHQIAPHGPKFRESGHVGNSARSKMSK